MKIEIHFHTVMKMLMIIRIHLKSKCGKLPNNTPLILIHFRLCPVPAKIDCRYNVNGFVEELPQLPESRYRHACAALPTGVRPAQPTC